MISPATMTAIELAWLEKGRALDVALRFNVTTNQVRRIWTIAKAEGRILNSKRQRGGYDFEAMLAAKAKAQSLNSSLPPFTSSTKPPVHGLKEVA